MDRKPINCITVLCDPRRVQRVAITCRCGHRWVELIPAELHDSDMTAEFECYCGQRYHLHNKQLHRVMEDTNGTKQEFARVVTNDKQHYDS